MRLNAQELASRKQITECFTRNQDIRLILQSLDEDILKKIVNYIPHNGLNHTLLYDALTYSQPKSALLLIPYTSDENINRVLFCQYLN